MALSMQSEKEETVTPVLRLAGIACGAWQGSAGAIVHVAASRCLARVPTSLFGAALPVMWRTDWKRQRAPYELT